MQELNAMEVAQVSGGILPLILVAAVILTGCGSPAEDKEQKNVDKIDDAVEKAGG